MHKLIAFLLALEITRIMFYALCSLYPGIYIFMLRPAQCMQTQRKKSS